jgi:hypothetical protein
MPGVDESLRLPPEPSLKRANEVGVDEVLPCTENRFLIVILAVEAFARGNGTVVGPLTVSHFQLLASISNRGELVRPVYLISGDHPGCLAANLCPPLCLHLTNGPVSFNSPRLEIGSFSTPLFESAATAR